MLQMRVILGAEIAPLTDPLCNALISLTKKGVFRFAKMAIGVEEFAPGRAPGVNLRLPLLYRIYVYVYTE